jgi:hypothetical protein
MGTLIEPLTKKSGAKIMHWKILETTDKEVFYDELNRYKKEGWYIHLETFGMDGERCYVILSKGFDI